MKLVVFGATGMVGKAALLEALDDGGVDEVVAVVRRPLGMTHAKLKELIHKDFNNYDGVDFKNVDGVLFCLGISSVGLKEPEYRVITVDYPVAAAKAIKAASPTSYFCLVTGAGTDRNSSTMWSRVKGEAEVELGSIYGNNVTYFRPGFIQPLRGVAPANWIGTFYKATSWLVPIAKLVAGDSMTTSVNLGRALVKAAKEKQPQQARLENKDINALVA